MTTRTYTPRLSEIERRWFVVDASGQTLGRLASQVAQLLAGKHKPGFATHMDTGDHVIVINASRIAVGGDKLTTKIYARHSGYPGGFRQETLGDLLARRPEEVIRRAVKGMLPRNRLGVQQLRKLKVYGGAEHPHEAQQPAVMPPTRVAVSRAQRAAAAHSASTEPRPAAASASASDITGAAGGESAA
jgi:large subunit ribosomal protein L13